MSEQDLDALVQEESGDEDEAVRPPSPSLLLLYLSSSFFRLPVSILSFLEQCSVHSCLSHHTCLSLCRLSPSNQHLSSLSTCLSPDLRFIFVRSPRTPSL